MRIFHVIVDTPKGPLVSKPKIAIILSTARAARFGHKAGQWIFDIAKERSDMEFDLVDLRDHPLPFFDEIASNAWVPTQNAEGVRWQNKVGHYDGYIFVTAEYNHGVPAVLKNALDYAYPEWNKKPAAFVGYGAIGAARAIEQLRLITIELQMAPTRSAVHLAGGDFMAALREGKPISEFGYLKPTAVALLDELAWWTKALKTAREATAKSAAVAAE
jgi:NAD(P)H-dependent FMN reductase